ncbi:MOSC domain-containing protein [soil metagenome]
MRGRVSAVCTTRSLQPRTTSTRTVSGIDKAAVPQVTVTASGVVGDQVLDTRHHGGADKAVYAYADEDAAWWAAELEEVIPPGRFGENLRTSGIDVTGAVIGERWAIGAGVVLEVSEPRMPCATFQHHMDDRSGWVRRFTRAGMPGAYLRVIAQGPVAADDLVTVIDRPAHGVTIGRWFTAGEADDARALLAAESDAWQMGPALRAEVLHTLA